MSYAWRSHAISSPLTSAGAASRTRWVNIALKLPDSSRRSDAGNIFEDQADVDASRGRGLDQRELLGPAHAYIRFLRRELDIVTESYNGSGQLVVDRPQAGLRAGVDAVDRIDVSRRWRSQGREGAVCDLIGIAMSQTMILFERGDDLSVLRVASRSSHRDPGVDGLSRFRLEVANEARHSFFGGGCFRHEEGSE